MDRFMSRKLALWTLFSAIMNLLLMAAVANDGKSSTNGTETNSSSTRPNIFQDESVTKYTTMPTSAATLQLEFKPSSSTTTATPYTTTPFFRNQPQNTSSSPFYSFLARSNSTFADLTGPIIQVSAAIPDENYRLPARFNSTMWQSNNLNQFAENSTTVLAQLRSNALLSCYVKNSRDGVTVSWIRRKDYHLLTVGLQTYSNDDRFQAIHTNSPDDWTLKIRFVQTRDAGIYECQVSTHPPQSIFVALNVIEAHAEINGGPDKFIKSDSTLRLICELRQSTETPLYVFWYQGLKMINYDSSRKIEVTHDRYSSTLVIYNVDKGDSGNYSCAPSNASPASIFVHIINGENPAAMQHGSPSLVCIPSQTLWALSLILSFTLQQPYFNYLYNYHSLLGSGPGRAHSQQSTSTRRIRNQLTNEISLMLLS